MSREPGVPHGLLIAALDDPSITAGLSPREWHELLQLARKHALLARLAAQLDDLGLAATAPKKARRHMQAAAIAAQSTQTSVRFEINRVLRALADLDVPIVLLKGAAYAMAELPVARGRFVGDLDFMVPRQHIDEVERALIRSGWLPAEMDDYDQRYYREWAHEIPPLQHPNRDTPLDVHHTIVPLTSRFRPDAAALFAASVPLATPRLRVLSPADMVLHSSVHLFNDDVSRPLRDLVDQHALLSHFGARSGFWDELVERARLHGLGRPLYHMLRQTQRMFGTGVPDEVRAATSAWAPTYAVNALMDGLFARRFAGDSIERESIGTGMANGLLYVRSHWLRMPFPLLVRHLSAKAARRIRERYEPKPLDDAGARGADVA